MACHLHLWTFVFVGVSSTLLDLGHAIFCICNVHRVDWLCHLFILYLLQVTSRTRLPFPPLVAETIEVLIRCKVIREALRVLILAIVLGDLFGARGAIHLEGGGEDFGGEGECNWRG